MKALSGRAPSIAFTKAPVSSLEEIFLARMASRASARVMAIRIGHYSTTFGTTKKWSSPSGRIGHQRIGLAAVADLVFAPFQFLRHHRGHGGHAFDIDLAQHLDPLEDAVQLSGHRLQPVFRHGQAGQFGDAAHGVLVDGHEVFLLC